MPVTPTASASRPTRPFWISTQTARRSAPRRNHASIPTASASTSPVRMCARIRKGLYYIGFAKSSYVR